MFKCFCWLFWSSEPNFLNVYWSKAMEEITWKSQIYGNIWIQTVSQSEQCRACFPCSKKDIWGLRLISIGPNRQGNPGLRNDSFSFCTCWNPALLKGPGGEPVSQTHGLACCLFFFFHIDLIQSTHFSSFFNSYLGTLKSCVSSLLSTCTYLWASVQMS